VPPGDFAGDFGGGSLPTRRGPGGREPPREDFKEPFEGFLKKVFNGTLSRKQQKTTKTHEMALEFVSGANCGARSAPFFVPGPFRGGSGPSSAGNRPQTENTNFNIFFVWAGCYGGEQGTTVAPPPGLSGNLLLLWRRASGGLPFGARASLRGEPGWADHRPKCELAAYGPDFYTLRCSRPGRPPGPGAP